MLFIVAGTATHEDGGGDLRGQDGMCCGGGPPQEKEGITV
jgi:hypothetical protein